MVRENLRDNDRMEGSRDHGGVHPLASEGRRGGNQPAPSDDVAALAPSR